MTKLRGTILASVAFAFLTTVFLFGSYVHSAVAQEPDLGAAATEQTEEVVELFVLEKDIESNLMKELNEKSLIVPDEIIFQIEEEVIESSANTSIPIPKPEIEIAEVKVIEIIKTPTSAEETESLDTLRAIEHEVHSRSNLAREKRNREDLIFDKALTEYARGRSMDMLDRNYFSHTSPDGCGIGCNLELSEYETFVWGENIARYAPYNESTMQAVAEIFVEKWLKSSGHRDNLLSKQYTHEGVGAAILGDQIIITVIFATPEK